MEKKIWGQAFSKKMKDGRWFRVGEGVRRGCWGQGEEAASEMGTGKPKPEGRWGLPGTFEDQAPQAKEETFQVSKIRKPYAGGTEGRASWLRYTQ